MKKVEYTIEMPYEYHPDRMGAKYKIGEKFKNSGEFLESVAKFHRGITCEVNPTTKWDEGSDIESENASVKSGKATLGCIYGKSVEEILTTYFERVASTKWIWITSIEDRAIEYQMNKSEFKEFCKVWARSASESNTHRLKVRFPSTSHKMLEWFEERVA